MISYFKRFILLTFILISLKSHGVFAGVINIIPVSGFHELETYIDEFKTAHPSSPVIAMADCDRTLTADYDTDSIHRHILTSSTLASLTLKEVPTLIATARFLTQFDASSQEESWQVHTRYSETMRKNLGVTLSDQNERLTDLDLRDETYSRGIFVNRILFTGHSKKGTTIARFVDKHPFFQSPTIISSGEPLHIFILDDDEAYVGQIREAFQDRPENVTILHYIFEPNFEDAPFQTLFKRSPCPTALSDLWYFIRHNHHAEVEESLKHHHESFHLLPLPSLASLVIDTIYSNSPHNLTLLLAHTPLEETSFSFETLLDFLSYAHSKNKTGLTVLLFKTFFKTSKLKKLCALSLNSFHLNKTLHLLL